MKAVLRRLVLPAFVVVSCLAADSAHAMFNLSVSPRRGTRDLQFESSQSGGLLRGEEVTVEVISDRDEPYKITRTIYQPLTNEKGDTLPQGSLVVFSASSTRGTIRNSQLETPVRQGIETIYNSNAAGESDSFLLVFSAHIPDGQPGGVYRTSITFTAEPVNLSSGVPQSTVTIQARIDIRSTFNVTLESSKGGRDLRFGRITKDAPSQTETLTVQATGGAGGPYRILQQLTQPLRSETGEELEDEALVYVTAGGEKGKLLAKGEPARLSESTQVLYASGPSGEGDVFQIQYQLKPAVDQKAGTYSGAITFKVEAPSAPSGAETFIVPIRIDIEPIFYLDARPQEGLRLHFGTFKTGDEVQHKSVALTVYSNLHEPYMVSQILSRKLTNEVGTAIPGENFNYYGEKAELDGGKILASSPTPVQVGETAIFTSDRKGSPEVFSVNYELRVPRDMAAGAYNSELTYSITTL